jgi:hypothetical protein
VQQPVFLFGKIETVCEFLAAYHPHSGSAEINGRWKEKTTPLQKKSPSPLRIENWGGPTYGVENANT